MSFEQEMQREQQAAIHAAIQTELREVWMRAWVVAMSRTDFTTHGATEAADKCRQDYVDRFL